MKTFAAFFIALIGAYLFPANAYGDRIQVYTGNPDDPLQWFIGVITDISPTHLEIKFSEEGEIRKIHLSHIRAIKFDPDTTHITENVQFRKDLSKPKGDVNYLFEGRFEFNKQIEKRIRRDFSGITIQEKSGQSGINESRIRYKTGEGRRRGFLALFVRTFEPVSRVSGRVGESPTVSFFIEDRGDEKKIRENQLKWFPKHKEAR